jgi:hypothetical protein
MRTFHLNIGSLQMRDLVLSLQIHVHPNSKAQFYQHAFDNSISLFLFQVWWDEEGEG